MHRSWNQLPLIALISLVSCFSSLNNVGAQKPYTFTTFEPYSHPPCLTQDNNSCKFLSLEPDPVCVLRPDVTNVTKVTKVTDVTNLTNLTDDSRLVVGPVELSVPKIASLEDSYGYDRTWARHPDDISIEATTTPATAFASHANNIKKEIDNDITQSKVDEEDLSSQRFYCEEGWAMASEFEEYVPYDIVECPCYPIAEKVVRPARPQAASDSKSSISLDEIKLIPVIAQHLFAQSRDYVMQSEFALDPQTWVTTRMLDIEISFCGTPYLEPFQDAVFAIESDIRNLRAAKTAHNEPKSPISRPNEDAAEMLKVVSKQISENISSDLDLLHKQMLKAMANVIGNVNDSLEFVSDHLEVASEQDSNDIARLPSQDKAQGKVQE